MSMFSLGRVNKKKICVVRELTSTNGRPGERRGVGGEDGGEHGAAGVGGEVGGEHGAVGVGGEVGVQELEEEGDGEGGG